MIRLEEVAEEYRPIVAELRNERGWRPKVLDMINDEIDILFTVQGSLLMPRIGIVSGRCYFNGEGGIPIGERLGLIRSLKDRRPPENRGIELHATNKMVHDLQPHIIGIDTYRMLVEVHSRIYH